MRSECKNYVATESNFNHSAEGREDKVAVLVRALGAPGQGHRNHYTLNITRLWEKLSSGIQVTRKPRHWADFTASSTGCYVSIQDLFQTTSCVRFL